MLHKERQYSVLLARIFCSLDKTATTRLQCLNHVQPPPPDYSASIMFSRHHQITVPQLCSAATTRLQCLNHVQPPPTRLQCLNHVQPPPTRLQCLKHVSAKFGSMRLVNSSDNAPSRFCVIAQRFNYGEKLSLLTAIGPGPKKSLSQCKY
jgi:hypothetical protein